MATKISRRKKTPIKSSEDEDSLTPSKIVSERARRTLSRSKSRENIDSANDDTPSKQVSGRKLNRRKTSLRSCEDEDSETSSKVVSERTHRLLSRSKSRESNESNAVLLSPNISLTKLNRRTSLQSSEGEEPKTPSKPKNRRKTSIKCSEDEDSRTPSKFVSERTHRLLSRSKSRESNDGASNAVLLSPNISITKLNRKTSLQSSEGEEPKTPSKPKNRRKTPIKSSDDGDSRTPSKFVSDRTRRSSSHSKSGENIANDVAASPEVGPTRRSTRISVKRPKLETIVDSVKGRQSDVEPFIDDDGWEYDVPPKNYFNENPDDNVHCHAFKTPKKKDGMVALAYNTPKRVIELKSFGTPKTPRTPKTPKVSTTPRTPKTPKSSRKIIEPKTPSNVRAKLQRGVRKRCKVLEEYEDDYVEYFEESGDDFQPSESSDSDVDSDNEIDVEHASSSDDEPNEVKRIVPAQKALPSRRTTRFSTRKHQDFVFESDKYFGHTNRKNATSDNTLDRLKTPRLQHEDMFKLLASHEISQKHQNCMQDLQSHYETFFAKWMLILREGFSVLLHGLGSKRNILEKLHRNVLSHENVLVVNGYFPSLTVKDILDDIATGLLETTCKSKNLHEIVDAIEEEMNETPDYHIFLMIHNIDGTMLRNDMAQNILSRLAHIPNVHLIASIDHINAPNLWDNIQLSNYNFSWWDVTSFLPYTDETSVAENSMLLKNSGALTIASMKSVLLSLTQNARGIYMIIVENQLASNKTTNYQGMPFKNLYKKCLEAFLVSSDIVLRTQLTEFCDHNLLKLKRTADGTEQLKIPIDNILLQQFVEQYSSWQLEN